MGYPSGQKAYCLYDLETRQIFSSRDVVFHESIFPFSHVTPDSKTDHLSGPVLPVPSFDLSLNPSTTLQQPPPSPHMTSSSSSQPNSSPSTNPDLNFQPDPTSPSMTPHSLSHDSSSGAHTSPPLPSTIDGVDSSQPPELRRGLCPKLPNVRLLDYDCSHITATNPNSSSSSVAGTRYPLFKYLSSSRLSTSYRGFVHNISTCVEPTSFAQANLDPMWRDAMQVELQALEQNHTWTMTHLPPGKRAIGSKWSIRLSTNPMGQSSAIKHD